MSVIGWGIASAEDAANDFVAALRTLPETEHKIVAVAAGNAREAEHLTLEYDIPISYRYYNELTTNPEIDVIYIGSTNALHYSYARVFMSTGKHVVCNTPLCTKSKETKELMELASIRPCQLLMESIMSRFLPSYEKIKNELNNGAIGLPLQVTAQLGVVLKKPHWSDPLCAGATISLSSYVLQLVTLTFGLKLPREVIIVEKKLDADKIDHYVTCVLKFTRNQIATLTFSDVTILSNEAFILGNRGSIKLCSPLWAPEKIYINDEKFVTPYPESKHLINFPNSIALSYEAAAVRQCILTGKNESPKLTLKESVVIAEMQDMIRNKLGVPFLSVDRIYGDY